MPSRHEQRLRQLEDATPKGRIDLDAEQARWEGLYPGIAADLGGDLPPWAEEYLLSGWRMLLTTNARGDWRNRTLVTCRRLPGALLALARRVGDPDYLGRADVSAHAAGLARSMAALDTRLPPDAGGSVVRRVLDVLAAGPGENGYFALFTCDACGMSIPDRFPLKVYQSSPSEPPPPIPARPFAGCPHCGGTARTWEHYPSEGHSRPRPWRDLAAAELDPDRRI